MSIRPATAADLPLLAPIERAAGRQFHDVGMSAIAEDEPLPIAELARYTLSGLAWVAVPASDAAPIGYLLAEPVDGQLHIEQVSVHPDGARRGVGRALIDHAGRRATADGRAALTLTTFTDVPWNAPYYARRCGFHPLADPELTPGLRDIRRRERELGLDRWPRVAMRRDLNP